MMAAPALFAALGVCAVEGWRVLQPQAALFAAPFVFSLADAIERNDVDQAYAFIRAGQDPNQPIAVRHPVLSGGRSILVSPIVWAVALQRREALLMLLGFGGQVGRAADGRAVCLAESLGNAEIVRVLVLNGSQPPGERCGSRTPGNAPLLDFAENSESGRTSSADPAL
jgi:hypothetical protein